MVGEAGYEHNEFAKCTDNWHKEPLPAPTAIEVGEGPTKGEYVAELLHQTRGYAASPFPDVPGPDDMPLPMWIKVLMFGGVAVMTVVVVLAILHCK